MAFRATLPIALALALAFAAGAQASGETDSCTVGCHSCLGVEISSVMEDSYFSPSASGSFADACTSCDAGYYLAPVDRCIGEGCSCPLGGDCKDLELDSYVLACTGPDCDCDESVGPCAQTGEEICALLFEVPVAPVRKMLAMDNDISTYMACVRAYAETGQCTECDSSCATCSGPDNDECRSCPANSYLDAGECTACEACSEGQYTTAECTGAGAVDATQCFDCPKGTFSADGYECYQCLSGSYNDAEGASECKTCVSNNYSPEGATQCIPCPGGYSSEAGAPYCLDRFGYPDPVGFALNNAPYMPINNTNINTNTNENNLTNNNNNTAINNNEQNITNSATGGTSGDSTSSSNSNPVTSVSNPISINVGSSTGTGR